MKKEKTARILKMFDTTDANSNVWNIAKDIETEPKERSMWDVAAEQIIHGYASIINLSHKKHEPLYLAEFRDARLAMLDIIDNEVDEKDKWSYVFALERITDDAALKPLQSQIDAAIWETRFTSPYQANPKQRQFVEYEKSNIDLNKIISRHADNELLTHYLIVDKQMPVSAQLRRHLYTNGHDALVSLIDQQQSKRSTRNSQDLVLEPIGKVAKSKPKSKGPSLKI